MKIIFPTVSKERINPKQILHIVSIRVQNFFVDFVRECVNKCILIAFKFDQNPLCGTGTMPAIHS